MAKTKGERETEEKLRQEKAAAFSRRGGIRRSSPPLPPRFGVIPGSDLSDIPEDRPDTEDLDQTTTRPIDQTLIPSSTAQPFAYKARNFKMTDIENNQLPERMKLKGKENYETWKKCMKNIAIANDLDQLLDPRIIRPTRVDEYNPKVNQEMLKQWRNWKKANSSMMVIMMLNVKSIPSQAIARCDTAIEMWTVLQSRYEGSGAVLRYNLLEDFENMKLENYPSLNEFINAYCTSIDKLSKLKDMAVPAGWQPLRFIMKLSDAYPTWAERQRSNSRREETSLSLEALIADISDEARYVC